MTWFWTEASGCRLSWVLLCTVFNLNTCFSSQGSQPHGAPGLDGKKNVERHIYIFPLYLDNSRAVTSVGCIWEGAKQETVYPQFSHLIIRERADHPGVTCFGIMAFLASGAACGAVRLIWLCGRRKCPGQIEIENKIIGRAKQVAHHFWKH